MVERQESWVNYYRRRLEVLEIVHAGRPSDDAEGRGWRFELTADEIAARLPYNRATVVGLLVELRRIDLVNSDGLGGWRVDHRAYDLLGFVHYVREHERALIGPEVAV